MREKPAIIPKRFVSDLRPHLVVGGARNEHGTRISRKVCCKKCKRVDYVAVSRSKKVEDLFCRECAQSEMRAHERGTKIKPEMAKMVCCQCASSFELPKYLEKQDPLFCLDCFNGFEVWRGSLLVPADKRASVSISRTPAGVLLRKNKSELI